MASIRNGGQWKISDDRGGAAGIAGQETLADMIGTTRSRVSHFMNKFRKLGFINYNGHLEVHSSLLSVVLHDQPHIAGVNAATGKAKNKSDRKIP